MHGRPKDWPALFSAGRHARRIIPVPAARVAGGVLAAAVLAGLSAAVVLVVAPSVPAPAASRLPSAVADNIGGGRVAASARAGQLRRVDTTRAQREAAARAARRRAAAAVRAAALASAAASSQAAAASSPPAAPPPSSGSARSVAQAMLGSYGWAASQFSCLDALWTRESGWSVTASNPSGAYGIPQALPGSKMASAGPDWQTSAATQIRWGLGYIKDLYASPCGAWGHEQAQGWY